MAFNVQTPNFEPEFGLKVYSNL